MAARRAPPWCNGGVRAWVWFLIAGCGRIGFDPSETSLPPPDDAVTEFPGAHADPELLPLATGQTEAATAPGAAILAKQSYLDPITGVRVWRLTDENFPLANLGANCDLELAGAQVSAAWNDDHHTIAIELDIAGGSRRRHLIDLQHGLGVEADTPLVIQGPEETMAFTADPTNPRVLFATDSSKRLHRIDTATNTVADIRPFPVDNVRQLPSSSAASRVLIAQREPDGYIAINTLTGAIDSIDGGSDSPAIDHDGAFVVGRVSGPTRLWRVGEPTTSGWLPPTGDFDVAAGVTGGFLVVDIDTGPPMELYVANPLTRLYRRIGNFSGYDTVGIGSQWIQTDVPADRQWVLYTTFERGFPETGPLDDAIGFLRLDGQFRLLAHHYGGDNASFYEQPRASVSPDGHLVVFTSTMGTGRADVYLAEVPLSQ